ncbi:MAG: 4-alpha-glucanotransferase, partial [Lachnospiraceae bacterium]
MADNSFTRGAGVLMPVSSLPSPYGIGTLGKDAYEFVDYIDEIRHSYWQVLPLGPTSYGDSPYQSYSAFAGNHYFIDLDMLGEDGLLDMNEVSSIPWGEDPERVDYSTLFDNRVTILKKAADKFFDMKKEAADYEKFCEDNAWWLDDFSLFMALKAHFEYKPWSQWEDDIKFRKPEAIAKYSELLQEDISFWKFTQFEFFKQWDALKEYANKKNIEIIGDIPIYMAYDSADVWANAGFFQLDEELAPVDVAGVPPDAFT